MKVNGKLSYHVPVLLNEVIRNLRVSTNSWYIDATAGGGGHTDKILTLGGNVLAIDQDEQAIETLKLSFPSEIKSGKLIVTKGNFVHVKRYITGFDFPVMGVLFDLGMSTFQIRDSGRGFSFKKNELLDMRMSQEDPVTAAEIVNTYSEENLYEIFRKFGEEHLARELAHAIFRTRTIKKLTTTSELRDLAHRVYQNAHRKTSIDPATRVFQALRIALNDELTALKIALPHAISILERGGRCLVISFHSLEDRIVKLTFREEVRAGIVKIITNKPIVPKLDEIKENPSARSAKLRVAQKL